MRKEPIITGVVPGLFPPEEMELARRTTLDIVIAWIVSILVNITPIGSPQYYADAKETKEEMTERYNSIANDLAQVVYDPAEKPLFSGANGRAKTALVLLGIAKFEAVGLRKDIDLNIGPKARGDSGQSWCMMQVLVGRPNKDGKTTRRIVISPEGRYSWTTDPTKGWGGEDLAQDRKKCFRAGLAIARESFHACGGLNGPLMDRLRVYARGNCTSEDGGRLSAHRMGAAKYWMDTKMSSEFKDVDAMGWLFPKQEDEESTSFGSPFGINPYDKTLLGLHMYGGMFDAVSIE